MASKKIKIDNLNPYESESQIKSNNYKEQIEAKRLFYQSARNMLLNDITLFFQCPSVLIELVMSYYYSIQPGRLMLFGHAYLPHSELFHETVWSINFDDLYHWMYLNENRAKWITHCSSHNEDDSQWHDYLSINPPSLNNDKNNKNKNNNHFGQVFRYGYFGRQKFVHSWHTTELLSLSSTTTSLPSTMLPAPPPKSLSRWKMSSRTKKFQMNDIPGRSNLIMFIDRQGSNDVMWKDKLKIGDPLISIQWYNILTDTFADENDEYHLKTIPKLTKPIIRWWDFPDIALEMDQHTKRIYLFTINENNDMAKNVGIGLIVYCYNPFTHEWSSLGSPKFSYLLNSHISTHIDLERVNLRKMKMLYIPRYKGFLMSGLDSEALDIYFPETHTILKIPPFVWEFPEVEFSPRSFHLINDSNSNNWNHYHDQNSNHNHIDRRHDDNTLVLIALHNYKTDSRCQSERDEGDSIERDNDNNKRFEISPYRSVGIMIDLTPFRTIDELLNELRSHHYRKYINNNKNLNQYPSLLGPRWHWHWRPLPPLPLADVRLQNTHHTRLCNCHFSENTYTYCYYDCKSIDIPPVNFNVA